VYGTASHPYLKKSGTGESELRPSDSGWVLDAVAEGWEECGENDVEVEFQEIAIIFARQRHPYF
jgi:hypothetical protein